MAAVLEIVESHELLDRQPVVQQSIRATQPLRRPDERRCRSSSCAASAPETRTRALPLARSIAGIAAALRNTG